MLLIFTSIFLILKIYLIAYNLSINLFLSCLFSTSDISFIINLSSNIEQFDLIFHPNKSGLDLIITCILAAGLIAFLLIQAQLLNLSFYPNATFDSEKYSPYECGFSPFKTERSQFDIKFYLVALLFLVFDVELMFLLPYCLTYYYLGFTGYVIFIIFFSILLVGFLVEWATGMLIWKGEKVLQNFEDETYVLEDPDIQKKTFYNYMHLYITFLDNKSLYKEINKRGRRYRVTFLNRWWFWRPYYTRGYVDVAKVLF
jgi:NADH-quinone oxidoreductase subunit A